MATDSVRIQGKVAAVLSRRELVLNVGSDDGVTTGMRFVILNRNGIDVKDPDSGAVLGTVEIPKTVVKIVRVDSGNMSVGRTFRTVGGTPGVMSAMSSLTGTPARVETLDIQSGSTLKHELSLDDSYIKIGDIAMQTEGDEYDDL